MPGSHLNPRESGKKRRKPEAEGAKREERCIGEITLSLRRERNLCNYVCIAFHWNVHLVLGRLQRLAFTQTESTMKRHAVTNTDTSVPEAEIIYRGLKTKHETEKPLGTETLQAG